MSSTSIDTKVVEMKFDNKDFEANVKNSLSTLDKLKEKLNFKGASSGLDSIQKASSKMDFSNISNGLDVASVKFSALQVAGITAISNITTSLMGLATNLVNTFAIQPRTQGFEEYELKMGSVQTIMASTGATVEEVGSYLDELNHYADQTIYSFSDMTNNIGKFTNAGVSLDKAVAAIKGISNEAAVSGATTAEASRAMYNFAQALSAGYVKLIDWKSIENANMATVEFKNQLLESAVAAGTLEKQADGMYKVLSTNASGSTMSETISATRNFNDSLAYQWMTTDVLVNTLNDYADKTTAIGEKAYKAAQDVKTFSMMMDTLKEAAGSGWAETFELIFGNFDQAKELWTNLTNSFSAVIEGISTARNGLIESVMQGSWSDFTTRITEAGLTVDQFKSKLIEVANSKGVDMSGLIDKYGSLESALQHCDDASALIIDTFKELANVTATTESSQEDLTAKLEYFQDVVDRVWAGEFKNASERYQLLADAGYDYVKVQELVNKTVDGHRLTLEDLGEEQLEAIGYTQEEIDKLKALSDEAQQTGSSLNDLINSVSKRTGRDLLFNQDDGVIFNFVNTLLKMGDIVRNAFAKIFDPIDAADVIDVLSNIQKATKSVLDFFNEKADALTRTLAGVLAPLKIITALISGTFKTALKLAAKLIGNVDTSVLDVTASVGDAVVTFTNWVTSSEVLGKVFDKIYSVLSKVIDVIVRVRNGIKSFVASTNVVSNLGNAFSELTTQGQSMSDRIAAIGDIFKALKEFAGDVADKIVEVGSGFVENNPILKDFVDMLTSAKDALVEFADSMGIIDKSSDIFSKVTESGKVFMADWFGIGDTSGKKKTVKEAIYDIYQTAKSYLASLPPLDIKAIFDGIVTGLVDIKNRFVETMSGFRKEVASSGNGVIDTVKSLNWNSIIAIAGALTGFYSLKKLSDSLANATKAIETIVNPFKPFADALKTLTTTFKQTMSKVNFVLVSQGILNLALAIGVIAISLRLVGEMPVDQLLPAVTAIASLIVAIGVVAIIAQGVATPKNIGSMVSLVGLLGALAAVILAVGVSIALIGNVDPNNLVGAITALIAVMVVMVVLVAAITELNKEGSKADLKATGKLMIKLGVALLLMSAAIAIAGLLDPAAATQGISVVAAMITFIGLMVIVGSIMPIEKAKELGTMFLELGVALILMVAAVALAGSLDGDTLTQGIAVVVILGVFLGLIVSVLAANAPGVLAAGGTILALAVSIGLLVGVCKLAGMLSEDEFNKGVQAIAAFGTMLALMVAVMRVAGGGQSIAIAGTIAALSIGIAALVGVAILCGMVDTEQLAKGVTAVSTLGLVFAAIMKACEGINEGALSGTGKTIIAMAAVIAAMTVCAILLGMMDSDKCMQGVSAVSVMGLVFSAMTKALGSIESVDFKKIAGTVALVMVILVSLAGIIWAMSALDVQSALPNAVSLATLLIALAAAMKIMSSIKGDLSVGYSSIAKMLVVVAGLAAVLGLMTAMNVQNAVTNAVALSIFMIAMAAAMKIMSTVKDISTDAFVAMGLMVSILALLAIVLAVMSGMKIEMGLEQALTLSTLLIALAVCVAIVGSPQLNLGSALAGVTAITAFLLELVGMFAILGAIQDNLVDLKTLVNDGIPVLEAVMNGLGRAIGGFVTGIADSVFLKLPVYAIQLSAFMTGLQPFINGAEKISNIDFASFGQLCDAILKITGAQLVDSITNFFGGNNDLNTKLVEYAEAIAAFCEVMKDVDVQGANNAATVAPAIAQMMEALPTEGGVIGFFTGSKSETIGNLKDNLAGYAEAVAAFATTLKDVDLSNVDHGVEASKKIIDILNMDMPTEGGWASTLFGDKTTTLANLASNLGSLGTAAAAFAEATSGIDPTGCDPAVKVIESVCSLLQEGGTIYLAQDTSTAGLKTKFDNLGTAAKNFADNTQDGNFVNADSAISVLEKVCSFMKNNLSNYTSGGNADTFVDDINTLGTARVSEFVAAFQNGALDMVTAGMDLMSGLNNGLKAGAASVKTTISGIVTELQAAFSSAGSSFGTSGTSMMSGLAAGINASSSLVTTAITKVMASITKHATDKSKTFKSSGKACMTQLADGIGDGVSDVKTTVSNALTAVANSIRSSYSSFYSAGMYCATGLSRGILAGNSTVMNAARAIARNAVAAAKKAAGVASPSKEFMAIGKWCAVGFANGIDNNTNLVASAGKNMSETVMDTAAKSLDLMNSFQANRLATATLTPVIDSSNLGKYYGTLDLTSSIKSSFADPLNGMQHQQLRSNAKLAKEIDKLRADVNEISKPTYNINGITYDDGTSMAAAVKDLTRAIRVERRA